MLKSITVSTIEPINGPDVYCIGGTIYTVESKFKHDIQLENHVWYSPEWGVSHHNLVELASILDNYELDYMSQFIPQNVHS